MTLKSGTPYLERGEYIHDEYDLLISGVKHMSSTRIFTTTALLAGSLFLGGLGLTGKAVAGEGLFDAIRNGKIYIDERYRFEYVDQENRPETAKASTLRNRIGFKSAPFYGFLFLVEWENVMNIGNDRFFNTINGKTDYPVVADVESHELNQLFLQYSGIPDTSLKVGRQVITVDNHRFIGHVGWRQNNQTFDAAKVINTSIPGLTLTYAYIEGVNRIFGNDSVSSGPFVGDWDSDSHIIHAAYKLPGLGDLKAYGFLLDFEDDAPANSSATFGLSLSGKRDLTAGYGLHYYAEYAHQEDYAENPLSYEADYYHLALGLSKSGLKTTVGFESLGSDDGIKGFSTPLATLHKFNGFADQFLATPATGLEDFYIDVTYKFNGYSDQWSFLNGILLKAQYHDFSSEEGGIDYGTEFDFFVKVPLRKGLYLEGKIADFNADSPAYVDVEKYILGVGWKY